MFVVHRAGLTLSGDNPAYLTGYGGFNISMTPAFSRSLLLWLEHGGVLAVPNIRGGGEYGEGWHQSGILGNKQNSFDDFIAAAEWLIQAGYTSPRRLGAAGGSNGGLLVGAVLTQRPELFRAVLVQVPLLDMLRYHRFLIARLWIPEYGSPDDPTQFRWLRDYSPYHRIQEGKAYPAVLLATAESDTRVDPMHARKMAARLQAASSGDHPVLLRLESRAGHGAGKPLAKVLDELTDSWTFVFSELEVQL
jgi:prolyl oligopeptidase